LSKLGVCGGVVWVKGAAVAVYVGWVMGRLW